MEPWKARPGVAGTPRREEWNPISFTGSGGGQVSYEAVRRVLSASRKELQRMGQKAPDLQSGDEWPPVGMFDSSRQMVVY